jgi:RNA polymerase sigma factor (sigma-70 family)
MSQELNAAQQKLFDDHVWIAHREARCFLKRNGRFYPRLEVRSLALEGLWRCAVQFNGTGVFGAFATQRIRWRLNGYYFGCNKRGEPNSKADRDAAVHEIQGSQPIASPREEVSTVMDLAGDQLGAREIAAEPSDDHLDHVLSEIDLAIRRRDLLDTRERKIIQLRFVEGADLRTIVAKVGVSMPVVKTTIRSGVRKLRTHFASLGYDVLPLDQAIQNSGNHRDA